MYESKKQIEKRVFKEIFCSVLQRVPIFLFLYFPTMYVLLCLYCHVKMPKQTVNCLERGKTSVVPVVFLFWGGDVSVKSSLILFPFLTIVQHESGTRIYIYIYINIYIGQLSYITENYPINTSLLLKQCRINTQHRYTFGYNLLVRALETGRTESLLGAFLVCFAASAN